MLLSYSLVLLLLMASEDRLPTYEEATRQDGEYLVILPAQVANPGANDIQVDEEVAWHQLGER